MSAVVDQLKRPHRWNVDLYHRMGEAGFFAPDARVELIDGEVFDMAPIGSPHFSAAADALLLIEVADTTLASDVNIEAPLYARHGIAEVWVVDLQGKNVCVLHEPRAGSFQQSSSLRAPGVLSPAALPDVKIDLAALLG
jgi:Putative restriction endonuclease